MFLFGSATFAVVGGYFKVPEGSIKQFAEQICIILYTHISLFLVIFLEWAVYKGGHDMMLFLNAMFEFKIRRSSPLSRNVVGVQSRIARNNASGILGVLFVILLSIIGPFVGFLAGTKILKICVFTVFFDWGLDAFSSICAYVPWFFLSLFHCSPVFYGAMEIANAGSVCGIFVLFASSIQANHLKELNKEIVTDSISKSYSSLRAYQRMFVMNRVGHEAIARLLAVYLGTGFYLAIFSFTLIVYGWSLLSSVFYPLVLLVTATVVILMYFGLGFGTEGYEESVKFLEHWRHTAVHYKNRLYIRKLVRSLKPLGFVCGDVGVLDNDRATTYLYSVIENTITCMLMFGNIIRTHGFL